MAQSLYPTKLLIKMKRVTLQHFFFSARQPKQELSIPDRRTERKNKKNPREREKNLSMRYTGSIQFHMMFRVCGAYHNPSREYIYTYTHRLTECNKNVLRDKESSIKGKNKEREKKM